MTDEKKETVSATETERRPDSPDAKSAPEVKPESTVAASTATVPAPKPKRAAAKKRPKKPKQETQPKQAAISTDRMVEIIGKIEHVEVAVETFNDMVPTAVDLGLAARTVTTFPSVELGRAECLRMHGAIQRARQPKPNSKEAKMAAKKTKTKTKAKTKTKKSTGKRGGVKRSKFPDEAKLSWIAGSKEIPFRKGSAREKRTLLAKSCGGMTVATFRAKGGRGSTLATLVRLGLVRVG